jgi:hypothetical protein
MYRWLRLKPEYLDHVRKFVATAKTHLVSLNQTTTTCPCSKCMNMRAHEDSVVQSHLIRFGFVKDYTVRTFHGEKVDASGVASGGNLSSSTIVNADHVGQPASSSSAAAGDDNADRDYITVEVLLQDMADDDGGGDGKEDTMRDPEDAELFEKIANRLDHDDVLLGSPR